jgi:uncharacterized Tic20 family protein
MTTPAPQPAAPQPAGPLTEAEDKQWASFAHFGGVLGLLPSLLIFMIFKDRGAKTKVESKEALNWQITWTVAFIVLQIVATIISGVLFATVSFDDYLTGGGSFVVATLVSGVLGFVAWVPYFLNFILSIVGGIKVNGGGSYRYPFAVRLIK